MINQMKYNFQVLGSGTFFWYTHSNIQGRLLHKVEESHVFYMKLYYCVFYYILAEKCLFIDLLKSTFFTEFTS